MVHNFLLLILHEYSAIDSKYEGRSIVLSIIVEFRMDELWWLWFSLILGAEQKIDIVFEGVGLEALQGK